MLQVSELDGGTAVIESTNGGRITVVDSAVDQSVPFVEVRDPTLLSAAHPHCRHVLLVVLLLRRKLRRARVAGQLRLITRTAGRGRGAQRKHDAGS